MFQGHGTVSSLAFATYCPSDSGVHFLNLGFLYSISPWHFCIWLQAPNEIMAIASGLA